ncbi:MAG: hypothetical protein M3Y27_29415, partial [Acidobacteriota bacterium]|nr:hypothetical protein [Acidobacteriota bacterium]
HEELLLFFDHIPGLKNRAALMTCYGAGPNEAAWQRRRSRRSKTEAYWPACARRSSYWRHANPITNRSVAV